MFKDNKKHIWIVGVYDQEVLIIEMPKELDAPSMTQRSSTRRIKLSTPLLNIETDLIDQKVNELPQLEA